MAARVYVFVSFPYETSATASALDSFADLPEQNAWAFRAMFLGLANLGVEFVQVVAQRMKHEASAPADAPTELHALVDAYDTTPRSLRRTELLVHKFAAPVLTPCHAGPRSEAARKPAVRRDVD
jgi:hypothetical protein